MISLNGIHLERISGLNKHNTCKHVLHDGFSFTNSSIMTAIKALL